MPDIYESRAELYDLIYHFKDYAAEARRVEAVLASLGVHPGARVLEGAMGTGGHAVHLAQRYDYAGFDLSPTLLAIARRKLPDAPLTVADLRSFQVDRPVDAFMCLFSSIGYLLDADALAACAQSVAAAVRPGGALLIEPWFTRDRWQAGRPTLQTYDSPELKIARASVSGLEDGDIAVTPMTYLVVRSGQPIETFSEVHRLWLAPTEILLATFGSAGFEVRFESDGLMRGRGLLVGTRRPG